MILKQFIPSAFCLKCQGCCRFREEITIWAPYKLKLRKAPEEYLCARFNLGNNSCKIYARRPLDCALYPFLIVKRDGVLFLGLHKSCSFVTEKGYSDEELSVYLHYLTQELKRKKIFSFLEKNPDFAQDYKSEDSGWASDSPNRQEDVELAEVLFLNRFSLKDKPLFDKYFKRLLRSARNDTDGKENAGISIYNFASIFIWREFFDIYWIIIDKCLCIFYRDKIGMFMILPPLGKSGAGIIKKCFVIMDFYNQGSAVSRMENVVQKDVNFFSADFKVKLSEKEFVYLRRDLVDLKGNEFKAKRANCNYFLKNYPFEVSEYKLGMGPECLELYDLWKNAAREKSSNEICLQMLEDSHSSFKVALESFSALELAGCVVKIDGRIKACSLGYPLSKETFCILFEVCDLSFKGIAQFIFREFCRKLSGYKYINVMGSCGLKNLEVAKLSWRPQKEIDIYAVYSKLNNSITQ